MTWNSLDDFLTMGGYGLYVWGSYALVGLTMVLEPILAGRRHRQALHQVLEPTESDH